MKYKAKAYGALCALEIFTVNGVEADEDDFVNQYDHNMDAAEPYGCGDMRADVKDVNEGVLNKYNINKDEYRIIAEDVAEKISFGECGWCI